jgi:aryl-alcohol dehydrogenase-like predicted oxidoreductase
MTATQRATAKLGATRLEITRVGLGAWAIGGGRWEHGWGRHNDDESIAAIQCALDRGINWIDTAAVYGFGRLEQVVGREVEGLVEREILPAATLELTDEDAAELEGSAR